MELLDLFSGIGGLSLGLERAGMRTVAFCEMEDFPRRVLHKHWPDVPIFRNVKKLSYPKLARLGIFPKVICGGFPCQDISVAGKGAGLAGARSGLWFEFERLISEIRPRWVIIENVSNLRRKGLDTILGRLHSIGYDAEWHCVPAAAIGAPHRRDRIWIAAYPEQSRRGEWSASGDDPGAASNSVLGAVIARAMANAGGAERTLGDGLADWPGDEAADAQRRRGDVADADGGRWREQGHVRRASGGPRTGQPEYGSEGIPEPGRPRLALGPWTLGEWAHATTSRGGVWNAQPHLGGEAYGFSGQLDTIAPWERGTPRTVGAGFPHRRMRLMALGNSVVPQMVQLIGEAIMEVEQ